MKNDGRDDARAQHAMAKNMVRSQPSMQRWSVCGQRISLGAHRNGDRIKSVAAEFETADQRLRHGACGVPRDEPVVFTERLIGRGLLAPARST